MRNVIASSLLLSLSRGSGIAIQALILLFLAHVLPIEDVGYFGLIYALLGIVRYLGPLGTDIVALRRIAREGGQPHSLEAQATSLACLTITVAASLVVAALAALWLLLGASGILSLPETAAIVLAVPAFALMGALAGQIRGFGRNLASQMPEALGLHALFGGLVIVLAFRQLVHRELVLVCLCAAAWTVVALYVLIRLRLGVVWTAPARSRMAALARDGLSVFQALGLTALSTRAPLLLTSALLGPVATAIMDIAARFGRVPEVTTNSVSITSSARFARESASSNGAILRTLRLSSSVAAAPALAWLLLVALCGPWAIGQLLPPAYASAYVPMVLVCLAVAINACLGLASTLLLMSDREEIVRLFSIVQLLVVVASALLLAPGLGVTGIAWSAVIGATVRDGGMMAAVILLHGRRAAIT